MKKKVWFEKHEQDGWAQGWWLHFTEPEPRPDAFGGPCYWYSGLCNHVHPLLAEALELDSFDIKSNELLELDIDVKPVCKYVSNIS